MMWHGDGWSWVWGFVMMTAVVGLLATLAWNLARSTPRDRGERRPIDATDILRERFARGEIDEEELDRRIEVLERHTG